jgi:hypothetical protein
MRHVLSRTKDYNLVVTGDNHEPFVHGKVVNCGSMIRSSVAQFNHRPRVYLCQIANPHEKQAVYIPMDASVKVIDMEKKEAEKSASEEVETFVRSLVGEEWDVGLSFKKNLRKCMNENKLSKQVKELVWKSLEDCSS